MLAYRARRIFRMCMWLGCGIASFLFYSIRYKLKYLKYLCTNFKFEFIITIHSKYGIIISLIILSVIIMISNQLADVTSTEIIYIYLFNY